GEDSVRTYGEYAALLFDGREITNVDQQRAANRLANALRRRGLGLDDRVVVMLPNGPEVLVSYAAILKLGAVIVPVVFLLGPDEVRHILEHSGAKLLITSPDLAGKAEDWAGRIVLVGGQAPGALTWDELVASETDVFATVDRAPEALAVILYTAGAAGQPKGGGLSHDTPLSTARSAASLYELDRERWSLAVLPLSHSYGLTLMNAGNILGTRAVLLRWFNPELVLETIQRYRVQQMAGVPTMFVYL